MVLTTRSSRLMPEVAIPHLFSAMTITTERVCSTDWYEFGCIPCGGQAHLLAAHSRHASCGKIYGTTHIVVANSVARDLLWIVPGKHVLMWSH